MTEREVYKKIQPLIEGYMEGLYWDFKERVSDTTEIIKDILAFSNSSYEGDSYIIVGVAEGTGRRTLALSQADRLRLDTNANNLYFPSKWRLRGLNASDINKMKSFSKELTDKIEACMLISVPQCEFVPIQIKKKHWLFVIIVKKIPGVFVSKKDLKKDMGSGIEKTVVKENVLYIRISDTTIGNDASKPTPATEHIRVWKRYIDWLRNSGGGNDDLSE